jgi:sulfide:quinone oxidoreductase
MPKVVIIGAGIGGIPAAFELRDLLGRSADIMVVSELPFN